MNVFDSESNKRINAKTTLERAGIEHGDLSQVPSEIYELIVEQSGYKSNQVTVSIQPNITTTTNIDLVPDNLTED